MTSRFFITHQEYGLPAKVSFDFDRRKGVVMATQIEVTSSPSTVIHFWIDDSKAHHGQVTTSLSGGVSPQSRAREVLGSEIADDLYKKYITLQKKAAYSPGSALISLISATEVPSVEAESLVNSFPSARDEVIESLALSCKQAAMSYRMLKELISHGSDLPLMDVVVEMLNVLRKKVLIASRYLTSKGSSHGPQIRSIILSNMGKDISRNNEK